MCTSMSYFQAHVDDRDYYGNKRLELAGQVCSTVRKTVHFPYTDILASFHTTVYLFKNNKITTRNQSNLSVLFIVYLFSEACQLVKLLIHLNNDLVFVFSQLLSLLFEDLFKRFNAEVSDKVYFLLLRCIFLQISLPASCGT